MRIYVKPSMEVIKLRPEEGIASFGSSNSSGDGGHQGRGHQGGGHQGGGHQGGGHQGGGHHGGKSNWISFWFLCNW